MRFSRAFKATYFYPRSPRGERPSSTSAISAPRNFYPRSPRGERQHLVDVQAGLGRDFYPRSPRGERHIFEDVRKRLADISIHAPREGSDLIGLPAPFDRRYFYPRSPRGERLMTVCMLSQPFQISIHAPREGSDGSCDLRG